MGDEAEERAEETKEGGDLAMEVDGTEVEAVENLEAVLGIEVKGGSDEGEGGGGGGCCHWNPQGS